MPNVTSFTGTWEAPDKSKPLPLTDLAGIFDNTDYKMGAISWRY